MAYRQCKTHNIHIEIYKILNNHIKYSINGEIISKINQKIPSNIDTLIIYNIIYGNYNVKI